MNAGREFLLPSFEEPSNGRLHELREAIAGVCQDFVHLSLILLRERGIAARYVSGYLFAAPENGGEDSVEVDTHAWVEALLPDARAASRAGSAPTPPTASSPARSTSRSATGATTATWRRSGVSIRAPPAPRDTTSA